jgi:hypothetical protein
MVHGGAIAALADVAVMAAAWVGADVPDSPPEGEAVAKAIATYKIG